MCVKLDTGGIDEHDAGRNTAIAVTMPQMAKVYAVGNTANFFVVLEQFE